MTVMTADDLNAFLRETFPQVVNSSIVEEVGPMTARVRSLFDESQLRPGGTVSGPTMMALVDMAMYIALMAQLGPVALAVTTNLNINFLRKPPPGDIVGHARIMKLGKLLATGEVSIFSTGVDEPVAHATCTYAIPPKR